MIYSTATDTPATVSITGPMFCDILTGLNSVVDGEPYRQWIKQSLAENKPWDELVGELISAEGLIWENPATGYMQRDANMPLDNMNNTVP